VVDPAHFRAVVRAGLGPVRGKFSFDVTWQELDAPSHARMSAQGKTPGSAVTADSSMDLTESPDGETELAWSADVVVHGLIASVGARLLNGFAEKQTQQFFECLRARLETASP
jgi:carbon monoxide dehydrogenase subunit G